MMNVLLKIPRIITHCFAGVAWGIHALKLSLLIPEVVPFKNPAVMILGAFSDAVLG